MALGALANSFTGRWPVTVTKSKGNNGTHCFALTDNGSDGFPHSGPALLDNNLTGQFQVIGKIIMLSVQGGGI